jgi:hypothetical protein
MTRLKMTSAHVRAASVGNATAAGTKAACRCFSGTTDVARELGDFAAKSVTICVENGDVAVSSFLRKRVSGFVHSLCNWQKRRRLAAVVKR